MRTTMFALLATLALSACAATHGNGSAVLHDTPNASECPRADKTPCL